ncbi:MAG TPA: type IV toxin-antitoxin system AbiEi family antitoxin [Bryobacteraceae bacterium]|nr:type IV toxin-antitoxin system AbiEi family antitoxin [Bryobacteraceae bacterium]
MKQRARHELEPVCHLRRLPFVRDVKYTVKERRDPGYDGRLEIKTSRGKFQLAVEAKRSYISRAAVSELLAWLSHLRADRTQGVILFATHIPRKTAEALIEAKVNFVDDAGNVHLELGDAYNWTAIGIPAPEPISERRPASPAQLQLLFQFVTYPESVNWPVRRLESAAGISKSKAAQARRHMIAEGLLTRSGKQYQLGPAGLIAEHLILGYAQVLRPKLTLGTFRPVEKTAESFLARLRKELPSGVQYSLSGGPAADLLQHFYSGPEVALFLKPSTRAVAQQLRLLPDREGPITILRAFGDLVFWEKREHHILAPPWLIYAELLSSKQPRTREAAQEFRREFLT